MQSNKNKSNGSRFKSSTSNNLDIGSSAGSGYNPSYNLNDNHEKNSSKNGSAFRSASLVVDKANRSVPAYSIHKLTNQLQSNISSRSNSKFNSKSLAKQRWNILKQAILNKNSTFHASKSSVRRFDSFGLIHCVKIAYISSNSTSNNSKQNNSNKYYKDSTDKHNYANQNDSDDDDDDICYKVSKTSLTPNKHRVRDNLSDQENEDYYEWFNVSVPSLLSANNFIKVRFYNAHIGLKDLVGFNNTGNICLWPSEEIMTYFCVKNMKIFENKSVCELGGGMTCLAGLMISKFSEPAEVFLTDGNESSFENLEVICSENEFRCSVECCLLQWSKDTNYGDLENRFDYIVCADCLFFDAFREDLCATIYKLLKMDGTCLIFAPNRQNTFHKFVDMAKLHFECMIVHDYDMETWEKHLDEKENNPDYDEDIHYPLLLKLKKRTRTNNDFCKMVL